MTMMYRVVRVWNRNEGNGRLNRKVVTPALSYENALTSRAIFRQRLPRGSSTWYILEGVK
jgi:hypothetical protein